MVRLRTALLGVLLGVLLALAPASTFAQGSEPNPPTNAFPRWEDIPDVMGYVSITVPQCTSPSGNQLGIRRLQPVVTWSEPSSVTAWLSWQIENTGVSLTCWGYAGLQQLANGLSVLSNSLILGVNSVARALLLGLLDLRGAALWFWYGLELGRGQWWRTEDFFNAAGAFINWLGQAMLAVVTFMGQFIVFIVNAVVALLGMLGWLLGFVGSLIGEALTATTWTPTGQQLATRSTPVQLQSTSPIYCGLRGALDGIHDSRFGWSLYLAYGLAYVGFVYWASRFFSGERSSS